jgi:fermentation-respiration switch protein FrsA (DUF1100 family)
VPAVLLRVVLVVVIIWAAVVAAAWLFQRSMIYLPITGAPPSARTFLDRGEDVTFETTDGLRLAAWFVLPEGSASGTTILVFNGNAGDRSLRLPLAQALSKAGHAVLLTDYRGYGGNPGRPSEEGLIADARAARTWLVDRRGVDPARLVYFGESLGTAVAIRLADEHPPAAVVLRSPFPSLAEVGRKHYPFLPVQLLLRDRFSCSDRISRLTCPVLVVAGEEDSIVPVEHSRSLFEAAREPKRLVVIPGADHNDFELLAGEGLVSEVLRFLAQTSLARA